MKDPNWIRAIQDELHELKRHNVWILIPRPTNNTIFHIHWVYKNKLDEDAIITRNKSRLVA